MIDNNETISSPWFVVAESTEECWSCGSDVKVFAILLPNVEDDTKGRRADEENTPVPKPCSLSYISQVNDAAATCLKRLSPDFYPDYSGAAGQTYWLNHCEKCSAKIGDFYLHSEPGHAFFPTADEEISKIKLIRIDIPLEANAGWEESGWIDDILEEAGF